MTKNIEADLLKFIRDFDPENQNDPMLNQDVDLIDGGYIDSFGMVELIVFVQSQWGVDLGGADFYANNMRSISGIAAVIAGIMG
jgi:acyl carrier protein